MLKDYKYNINQEVVVVGNAKDLLSLRGEKATVIHMLPTSYNHDYIIEFENNKELRVKEKEIAPIDNKELLNIKTGDLVVYTPTQEVGEVLKVDYYHGHVEIRFKDSGSAVTGIESLRKFEESEKRKSWDQYFMDIASMVATRATCDRLHVGCVITKDKRIISTGYNGSPSGQPHCDDVGHLYNDQKRCIRTIHAEQNAILYSNREDLEGATAYVTHQPCENCAKLLVQSGVIRVVFKEKYSNKHSDFFLNMVESKHLEG